MNDYDLSEFDTELIARQIRIGERVIGSGFAPYVIAELGVNHDGDPARALELASLAADAGADAIKLQYFEAERLMSRGSRLAAYQERAGEVDPVAMLKRLELGLDAMAAVIDLAHRRGIHAIVSIFSVELVEAASRLPWDAYKTASPDIVNLPLLESLMATGKPLIVSTGASTIEEVQRAAGWLQPAIDRTLFMQCVSSYPTPPGLEAFEGIDAVARVTSCPCGYSDHTSEVATARAACEAGAWALEKHFTHDRAAQGPDHAASLDRDGLAAYCRLAKETFESGMCGMRVVASRKHVLDIEQDVRTVSRQSLVPVRDLPEGHVLTHGDLTIKRPGTGLAPWMLLPVMGCTLARRVEADFPLQEADVSFCPRA